MRPAWFVLFIPCRYRSVTEASQAGRFCSFRISRMLALGGECLGASLSVLKLQQLSIVVHHVPDVLPHQPIHIIQMFCLSEFLMMLIDVN